MQKSLPQDVTAAQRALKPALKPALMAAGLAAAVLLAGCAADEIEFNGKIFDALGVNSSGGGRKEATVAERAPLVLPPSRDRLPEPGSDADEETAALAEIHDPDAAKEASKEELQRQQEEYCRKHYEPLAARGDESAAAAVKGPLGNCRPSILSSLPKVW